MQSIIQIDFDNKKNNEDKLTPSEITEIRIWFNKLVSNANKTQPNRVECPAAAATVAAAAAVAAAKGVSWFGLVRLVWFYGISTIVGYKCQIHFYIF